LLAPAVLVSGCAAHQGVARLVDGKAISSRYIEASAYDAYLEGAIAESSGRDAEALAAFEAAAEEDEESPDIWTRIGSLECRLSAADRRGLDALRRALQVDPTYGPAHRAIGVCEEARGHHAEAQAAFAVAAQVDPGVVSAEAVARHDATLAGRTALLAITERHGGDPAAWVALAEWSRAHGDPPLYQRAFSRALAEDTSLRGQAALGAVWLADVGYDDAARALAGQAVDRMDDPLSGRRAVVPELVALLAVDDAILSGDTAKVARRLVEARVPPLVAGLRARLLGRFAVMQPLLSHLSAAEPDAAKAIAALATSATGPTGSLGATATTRSVEQLLAESFPRGGTRGDELIDAAFADAAARGLAPEANLNEAAKLELAARRQLAPAAPTAALDACHRLLALSLRDPRAPETMEALRRLGGAPDRLVAIAAARVALATSAALPASLDDALAPYVKAGDPLALAAALELVNRRQDAKAAARLRSALAAVAATDVERKLSAGAAHVLSAG
jgi:hypothetical protein